MATSFKTDIAPMFEPYRANMIWRFDLTDYETVKGSAAIIYQRIIGNPSFNPMPAPPMEPLSLQQTDLFKQWMSEGFPP